MTTNPPSTAPDPISIAMLNLSAAGISFTEVPACPDPACSACRRARALLATAA